MSTDIATAASAAELEKIVKKNKKDWEVVPAAEAAEAASRLGAMISVRFEPDVARLIRKVARIQGISQSEFVRRSAEASAQTAIAGESVQIELRDSVTPPVLWDVSRSAKAGQDLASAVSSSRDVLISRTK